MENELVTLMRRCGAQDENEVQSGYNVLFFLQDNHDLVARPRGKSQRVDITTTEGIENVAKRFLAGRRTTTELRHPKTIPDPAVGVILETVRGYDNEDIEQVILWHQEAMAAENILGTLLEKYIASQMEHFGWAWCSGEVVKSVDFIKWDDNLGWVPIQIKNRSNSENSSSMAIRNGTAIQKWHRSNAYTGDTNWNKFPEPELQGVLTEEGFRKFIRESI